MMRVAAALTRRWADWADALSRRTHWWEISQPEKVLEALQQRGAELPVSEAAGCAVADYGGTGCAVHGVRGCRLSYDHMEFNVYSARGSSPALPTLRSTGRRKRNAISHALVDELLAALDEVEAIAGPGRHPHRCRQGLLCGHGSRRIEGPAGQNA